MPTDMNIGPGRIVPKEVTPNEILSVREYAKKHGGLKRIEERITRLSKLVEIPNSYDSGRQSELLKANLEMAKRLLDHATTSGGLGKTCKEIEATMAIASKMQNGGTDRVKMAIDFIKKYEMKPAKTTETNETTTEVS